MAIVKSKYLSSTPLGPLQISKDNGEQLRRFTEMPGNQLCMRFA
jgi:hypothetical protein